MQVPSQGEHLPPCPFQRGPTPARSPPAPPVPHGVQTVYYGDRIVKPPEPLLRARESPGIFSLAGFGQAVMQ